jgi:hypothetical protein
MISTEHKHPTSTFYILTLPDKEPVYPYTLTVLKGSNPETSFPTDMTNFDASDWHCYPVQDTTPPEAQGKVAHRITPIFVDGAWIEQWELVEHTAEDIERQWTNIRSERNQYLAECDWTQLPDAPVDAAEWVAYRQDLRDITEQADPFNLYWPTPPLFES